jgi:hypothetical protein
VQEQTGPQSQQPQPSQQSQFEQPDPAHQFRRRPRAAARRRLGPCALEALEPRRLLSVMPPPFPGFVGPMPMMNNPYQPLLVEPGSGPTSVLSSAPRITATTSASYSFYITYRDDVAVSGATIDSQDIYVYGPNGYVRRAILVSVDATGDGEVRVARYKVAAPNGSWNTHANGYYTVTLQANQVTDIFNTSAPHGVVGQFVVQVGVGNPLPGGPSNPGIDVRDFGAIPNDGIDDTDEIQAAIDSLPMSNGVPDGRSPAGGIVLLPAGVFDISRPLKVHSGITLRGAGNNTVIHHVGTNRSHAAIELWSPFTHHFNSSATIENLSIYARWGIGISVDPFMFGDVTDLRLANLRVSALGAAIDLRNQAVYHSDIDNVEVYNPGSTALWVGRRNDGWGADMRVRNFRVTGNARGSYVEEQGIVVLTCDALVQGLSISVRGADAVPLYVSIGGGLTMYDVNLTVPTQYLPGDALAHFNNVPRVDIDYLSGVGMGRRIRMTDAHDVQIKYLESDGSSNILSRLTSKDDFSYVRVGNAVNGRLLYPGRPAGPTPHTPVPAPTNVIDARDFGVIPDDDLDDTEALQAAIDSLPLGDGIPGGSQAVGGIVQLPIGMLVTSAPLRLPSGVWLRGHNAGTVIRNLNPFETRAVIEFVSPYTHGDNVGAGLIELGIYTIAAPGMRIDRSVRGEVRDLRLIGLKLTTGGPSVDLRDGTVTFAQLDRILISNPGSTTLWLGREDNSSTGNTIRGFRMTGYARPDYIAEKAMFVLHATDTVIEGGSIEVGDVTVRAFHASGSFKMDGLYMEFPYQADGIGFMMDGVTRAEIDRLLHVNPQRRLHLVNGSNVIMRCVHINGVTSQLRDTVAVDGSSRLELNTVYAQRDAGMLDHPRVIVRGAYNEAARSFVESAIALNGSNLVVDPNITNVSDLFEEANWFIQWGSPTRPVSGTWSVETTPQGKRLKLVITSNPTGLGDVSVRVKLNVPSHLVGKYGIARWRVDGAGEAFAYMRWYDAQFQARVTKSLTAAKTPIPLRGGEELWIDLSRVSGTYYISKVGMVAAP